MSPTAATYRTRPARPQLLQKAERLSTSGLWTKSILSFPDPDLAGDVVVPSGIDWTPHQSDPAIDLEHSRDPAVGDRVVAWARESLSEPGAPYAVEYKSLNFAGPNEAPRWVEVPVGTDYFDPGCKLSMQVFALREQDALPASSLEFRPLKGFMKSLGRSPLENRDAYEFGRCEVVRWTICAKGVCPQALTFTKSHTAPQVPSELDKILADRRVNVGGTVEALHPYILKALGGPPPSNRTTVRLALEKAMNEDELATQADDMVAEAAPETDSTPALGGVSAKYKFADAIRAAYEEYEADMQSSDSPELRKLAEKFKALAESLEEQVKGAADKHDAKLNKKPAGGEAEGDDSSDADDAPAAADTSVDEEGTYKAVRRVYKPILKALHVKRFKLAELNAAAPEVKKAAEETLEEAITRIRREDPEGWRAIQRERDIIASCS